MGSCLSATVIWNGTPCRHCLSLSVYLTFALKSHIIYLDALISDIHLNKYFNIYIHCCKLFLQVLLCLHKSLEKQTSILTPMALPLYVLMHVPLLLMHLLLFFFIRQTVAFSLIRFCKAQGPFGHYSLQWRCLPTNYPLVPSSNVMLKSRISNSNLRPNFNLLVAQEERSRVKLVSPSSQTFKITPPAPFFIS